MRMVVANSFGSREGVLERGYGCWGGHEPVYDDGDSRVEGGMQGQGNFLLVLEPLFRGGSGRGMRGCKRVSAGVKGRLMENAAVAVPGSWDI